MDFYTLTRKIEGYVERNEVVLTFEDREHMESYIKDLNLVEGVDYTDAGPEWQPLKDILDGYNELTYNKEVDRVCPKHEAPKPPKFWLVKARNFPVIKSSWKDVAEFLGTLEEGECEIKIAEWSLEQVIEYCNEVIIMVGD